MRDGRGGSVPTALRDAHYPGAEKVPKAARYRYPHDDPAGVVAQQHMPEGLHGREYYTPTTRGNERAVAERLETLRKIIRGAEDDPTPDRSSGTGRREAVGVQPGDAYRCHSSRSRSASISVSVRPPERTTASASRPSSNSARNALESTPASASARSAVSMYSGSVARTRSRLRR